MEIRTTWRRTGQAILLACGEIFSSLYILFSDTFVKKLKQPILSAKWHHTSEPGKFSGERYLLESAGGSQRGNQLSGFVVVFQAFL
jgi:hypothetical protein